MVQHRQNAKRRATRSSFPFFSNGAVGVLLSEPAPAWPRSRAGRCTRAWRWARAGRSPPSRTFPPLVTGWLGDSDEVRGDFQGPALAGPQRHSTSSQPPDAPWTASGFRGAGGSGRRKAQAAGRAEPLPAKQCFSHYLKVPTLNYINYSERYNNLET